jgi:hypothetical protein
VKTSSFIRVKYILKVSAHLLGDVVEYDVEIDSRKAGKKFAMGVTGPNRAYVVGVKRSNVY